MVQMQLPKLRERVNACYGYNAISRILLTQTAPTGFAEGQAEFAPAPKPKPPRRTLRCWPRPPRPRPRVQDDGLRARLKRWRKTS